MAQSKNYSGVVPEGDYIAVLTGDRGRIALALNSVKSAKAKYVFISGVYEKTTISDILMNKQSTGVYIILGKRARNTEENASEVCEWATNSNIHSLTLVTSDYHMIRSLVEIRCNNPSIDVKPVVIPTQSTWKFMRKCFNEFHKVLFIYMKRYVACCY